MTIKEARECLDAYAVMSLNEKSMYNDEYYEAKGVVNGYEAKEKELENALVIPEGWHLSTYGFIDDGRDKPFYIDLMRRGELVKGYGATEHEALINAIKQIK